MTEHVHSFECTKSGGPCNSMGARCNAPHPDRQDLKCARLDGHVGDHDSFGLAMKRVHWN
ncbi:hypothetical protein A6I87_02550 [Prescottella equi]|nr:hypothetical protein A6I87_02550 [Prescottella equi]